MIHDQQHMEKQMEKQMGCMAGFFQIFDRHHLLAGKRIYATKRLPSSPITDSEKSNESPAGSKELKKEPQKQEEEKEAENYVKTVPEVLTPVVATKLPVFEFKEGFRSSWKFRESPRLSLDSRASVDGKGSLYPREIKTNAAILSATRSAAVEEEDNDQKTRSPSVIARLMGLEALPEPRKKPELRRSNSESRSRDLVAMRDVTEKVGKSEAEKVIKPQKQQQQKRRKSYFDSEDFFPEPKQSGSIYGEIEKRLKMRGIDEPEKDLEALKQILEALQLKGLLRSKKRLENRNYVFDPSEETSIVVMKPKSGRIGIANNSPPSNFRSKRLVRDSLPPVRPRPPERRIRNSMSPDRSESNVKSPSSLARRKMVERRGNDSVEQRRSSPVHSPKIVTRKTGSPRNGLRSTTEICQKQRICCATEDESSSISECSFSTIDTERSKTEEYKEGKILLMRCDKLLHSIADITSIASTTESQPSPVSVLDSSFYHDDSSSPSPVKNRCIDFKDQFTDLEDDDHWSQEISSVGLQSVDPDFLYVSQIFRAFNRVPDESNLYFLLEKQQYKSNSCKVSRLHRKVVFGTITEILDRKKQLRPWKAISSINPITGNFSFRQMWLDFLRVREPKSASGDLFEVIFEVLEKDMAGDSSEGWSDCAPATSEVVLDIERLIFKDLVGDTIRDLAAFSGESKSLMPRRKLEF